jgi:hypothetical protein
MMEFLHIYTVKEFKEKYRPDGKGHQIIGDHDTPFDEVVCDICNAEIVQPENEPDKKVIWMDSVGAYCENCKDDEAGKKRLRLLEHELKELGNPKLFDLANSQHSSGKNAMFRAVESIFDKSSSSLPVDVEQKKLSVIKALKDSGYNNVRGFVEGEMMRGIDNGWLVFKNGISMTSEQWKKLSSDEKEKYPVAITEEGKEHSKVLSTLFSQLSDVGISSNSNIFFSDVKMSDDGMITFTLTEDGRLMKMVYELNGQNFADFLKKSVAKGTDRLFNSFIFIDKDTIFLTGQSRVGLMTYEEK